MSSPPVRDPLQAVSGPAGPAPVRRAGSVRRTSTLDMTWPAGFGTQLRLDGAARDAVTHSPVDAPVVVGRASCSVGIGGNRTIEDISSEPRPAELHQMIQCRGGGYLRAALAEFVPEELERGTPLYLLLDDISGASLVAGFAWSQWTDAWKRSDPDRPPRPDMEGVCIGFRPGASALDEQRGDTVTHRVQVVPPLVNPADPFVLTSVDPEARVLPFLSCPAAVHTAALMVGTPLPDLRTAVLDRLARTQGCTHLNDALRALAEVPVLLTKLDEVLAAG